MVSDDVIRMGYISSFDASAGMASVVYPDRDATAATSKMPVFLPFGVGQKLQKDDAVLVVHLSNGSEVGIVLGAFAQEGEAPGTSIASNGGDITFSAAAGSISVSQLIGIRDTEIPGLKRRIEALGG